MTIETIVLLIVGLPVTVLAQSRPADGVMADLVTQVSYAETKIVALAKAIPSQLTTGDLETASARRLRCSGTWRERTTLWEPKSVAQSHLQTPGSQARRTKKLLRTKSAE
jgi:hypothetical protein